MFLFEKTIAFGYLQCRSVSTVINPNRYSFKINV